ncbi:hypothetical protein CANINC_000344 [Pichia inconspicua]|uniref:GH16 domain-containing protein n=1 Tax=Pichia inconspicua TaxID=52247 RepID=A0A4V6TTT7_9ASCO|nr:hypothetical protein CANINC_000344 [[Candida] inconspicua]
MKLSFIASALLFAFTVQAIEGPRCSAERKCPEEYPCCSNEGICGTDSYCLDSCNPKSSFRSDSCLPDPICKAGTFTPRIENMIDQVKYPRKSDFTYFGSVEDIDDSLMIKLFPHSMGSTISSTFYIWYGKVSVDFRSSNNQGVVSSFSLVSQVQDEIDFDIHGSNLTTAETNFSFESNVNQNNESKVPISNIDEEWHTYTIDWTEDQIQWLFDNEVVRTLKKVDTWNESLGIYEFPQTPSRIQLSIKPESDIDWNGIEFNDLGYSYVAIDTVEVVCYDPPSYAIKKGNTQISYLYDGDSFLSQNIKLSDRVPWVEDLEEVAYKNIKNIEEIGSKSPISSSLQPSSRSSKPRATRTRNSRTRNVSISSTPTSTTTTSSSTTTKTTLSFTATGFIQDIHTLGSSSSIKNNAISSNPTYFSIFFAMLSLFF